MIFGKDSQLTRPSLTQSGHYHWNLLTLRTLGYSANRLRSETARAIADAVVEHLRDASL